MRFRRAQPRTGPAVRSASLLEQREFEPPVLFVVPDAYERLSLMPLLSTFTYLLRRRVQWIASTTGNERPLSWPDQGRGAVSWLIHNRRAERAGLEAQQV